MVADQRARPAMAIRPHHTVGRARFRSDEPADADGPRRAVLDRMDGPMAGRSRARRRPEIRRDHRMGGGLAIRGAPCDCRNARTSSHTITPTSCRIRTTNCLLCPASVITRQARCCRSLSANVSRWSTRTSAVCCHVRSSASNRSAAAQVPRNARWRNGCCRTMIPRNAVVSIARPSCGTRPSWNSARRCALRNRHYAKPVRSPENARSYATEDRDWGSGVRDHANDSKVRTGRCAGWC